MDSEEALGRAEPYAPLLRSLMRDMLALGVREEDLVGVTTWAMVLVTLALLDTPGVQAIRAFLGTYDAPRSPSREAARIAQAARHVGALGEVWTRVLLDGVPEGEIPEVLLAALRIAETDRALDRLGAGFGLL